MTSRYSRAYNFRIDPELADGLKALKARDGVAESETIRRAVRAWFRKSGLSPAKKTERRRVVPRKRS